MKNKLKSKKPAGQLSQFHIKNIKKICSKYSKDEEYLEFDIFNDVIDDNGTKFLYLYFKDYSFRIQESNTVFCITNYLKKKNIRYVTMDEDDEHKLLIWIPLDKKNKYLIISKDEVYECR